MAVRRAARIGWRVALCCAPLAALTSGGAMGAAGPAGSAPPSRTAAGAPGSSGTAAISAAATQVREQAEALAREQGMLSAANARLTSLRTQAEVLAERYDQAVAAEGQAASAYRLAAARLATASRAQQVSSDQLAAQAASDYESGGALSPLAVMLADPRRPQHYLGEAAMEELLAGHHTDRLAASRATREVAEVFRQQAGDLLTAEQADVRATSALKIVVQAAVDRQLAAVSSARSTRNRLVTRLSTARANEASLAAARQAGLAAQAAAAAQRAAAALGLAQVANIGVPAQPPLRAHGSGASATAGDVAANWAMTQVGKPYQWGAAGPFSYDCSGLTMDAWSRAGVQLGHWTGDQWDSGPHVPLDQLQRGDLIFFATDTADPGTIHHVGIYIGSGEMVDAPYTGADVRVESMYHPGGLIGATRPVG
jgi:cell wall-associated NlpC family hydrolase